MAEKIISNDTKGEPKHITETMEAGRFSGSRACASVHAHAGKSKF